MRGERDQTGRTTSDYDPSQTNESVRSTAIRLKQRRRSVARWGRASSQRERARPRLDEGSKNGHRAKVAATRRPRSYRRHASSDHPSASERFSIDRHIPFAEIRGMKHFQAIALVIVLDACTPTASFSSVSGSGQTVSIGDVLDEKDGLPAANRSCAHHGLVAKFDHMERYTAFYECVRSGR